MFRMGRIVHRAPHTDAYSATLMTFMTYTLLYYDYASLYPFRNAPRRSLIHLPHLNIPAPFTILIIVIPSTTTPNLPANQYPHGR